MKIPLRRAEPDPEEPGTTDGAHAAPHYLRLACPNCSAILTVDTAASGTPVQCGDCHEYLIVPKGRYGPSVVIGDYVLRRQLGSGGMGTVYLAHQRSLDRLCALKILQPAGQTSATLVRKLQEEARVAARLSHPNMVQCYAVGHDDDTYYYAMEYVPGKSLGALLEEKLRLTPGVTLDMVRQVADALDHGWKRQRLVHRDIKPDNILMDENGDAKLADLGIARSERAAPDTEPENRRGTPCYMCPEQTRGESTDQRGDIFSLGIVAYHCLTGHLPFPGDSPAEIAARVADAAPPDPQSLNPDLPTELCAVLLKMLAKAPEQRYQDYDALISDLDGLRARCPDSRVFRERTTLRETFAKLPEARPATRRQRRIAGLVVAVLCVAFLGVAGWLAQALGLPLLPTTAGTAAGNADSGSPSAGEAAAHVREPTPLPTFVAATAQVVLEAALPDPEGYDEGRERVRLRNLSPAVTIDLNGWSIRDEAATLPLAGTIGPEQTLELTIPPGTIRLPNAAAKTLELYSPSGARAQTVSYAAADVQPGQEVRFAR